MLQIQWSELDLYGQSLEAIINREGVSPPRGVDRQTELKWKFRASNQVTGSPVVTSDYVIFGGWDKSVYCVDKETGRKCWDVKADHQVQASPVAYRDLVYFVCAAGCLYAVEISSGEREIKVAESSGGNLTGKALSLGSGHL